MISTVTTIVTFTGEASIGVLATLFLISLLGVKEFINADTRQKFKALGKRLNVCIIPLLLIFALIVVFKALEVIL
ncbi:MAG: hypothetical protein ACFCUE_15265 [Candidatus Bathyarchaeia archaeon]|jgi:hypothetical protein